MLSGKLSIERADNGWLLSWFDRRNGPTGTPTEHREVFEDATACLRRIADVTGMPNPDTTVPDPRTNVPNPGTTDSGAA